MLHLAFEKKRKGASYGVDWPALIRDEIDEILAALKSADACCPTQ